MKNPTKKLLLLLATATPLAAAQAQTTSGLIKYEGTQRTDPSQMRVMVNGQEVKPGSPDFPTDIPESRSFGLTLAFAGNYAREERENMATRTVIAGPNQAPEVSSIGRPFEEISYVDQASRATSTVLTLKKDQVSTTYRSDLPFAAPTNWQLSPQTKKIAGYICHKATVPYRKDTYTVWYTTDLPFTYSPVKEIMPEKGVVLALESEREQYRATKVDLKPVAEAEVRPSQQARSVTAAELQDLREKARADFRQRMMDASPR
jgi:GLPGLI family protein